MNTDRIAEYLWVGRNDQHWYRDCQELFEKHFGKEQLPLVTKLFAATSIHTSLPANVRLFRKALYEIREGLPFGKYLPVMLTNLQYARDGKPLSGRKINNFAAAMAGQKDAVVVDIWQMRAFGIGTKRKPGEEKSLDRSPTKKEYDSIEMWYRRASETTGLQPRELSAMVWAGVRIVQANNKQSHYKQLLDYHLNNLYGCL